MQILLCRWLEWNEVQELRTSKKVQYIFKIYYEGISTLLTFAWNALIEYKKDCCYMCTY
jgi:hypothetical protein